MEDGMGPTILFDEISLQNNILKISRTKIYLNTSRVISWVTYTYMSWNLRSLDLDVIFIFPFTQIVFFFIFPDYVYLFIYRNGKG